MSCRNNKFVTQTYLLRDRKREIKTWKSDESYVIGLASHFLIVEIDVVSAELVPIMQNMESIGNNWNFSFE